MIKYIISVSMCSLFFSFLALPAQAKEIRDYLAKYQTMEEKTQTAVAILRCTYPDWQDNYKKDEFDCSEMSAYVKHCFDEWGIPAVYCQSNAMWHCWVEVPNGDSRILIEATSLTIVPQEDWQKFYQYPDICYNPHMSVNAIDWWNSRYLGQCGRIQ